MNKISLKRESPVAGIKFGGQVGRRVENNIEHYLSQLPFSCCAMFTEFEQKDLHGPDDPVMGFYVEFPGKLLTAISECLRLSPGDERLLRAGDYIVERLYETQSKSGYIGFFPEQVKYLGTPKNRRWDVWGVCHILYGLYLWRLESGSEKAWKLCIDAADDMRSFFVDGGHGIEEAGSECANESGGRVFLLLYEATGDERYLEMARKFEQAWQIGSGGDFLREGLNGTPFAKTKQPRWESLHALIQLAETYRTTGDKRYLDAFVHFWRDIRVSDIHNTGGYSSGEGSTGNPFALGSVELCCSVTWAAMTAEYLKLTSDPLAADELERCFFNALLGSQHPTGRWWTYSSPMCGEKKPSLDIVIKQGFHFNGCHELNCCASNAGRGIGILSQWAVTESSGILYLNYYGPCTINAAFDGGVVAISEETLYPADGKIKLTVDPDHAKRFTLMLRIPFWSKRTRITVCGDEINAVESGKYLRLERFWKPGDEIELTLDLSPRLLHCVSDPAGTVTGYSSIYWGPILLTFDTGDNPGIGHTRVRAFGDNDYQAFGWRFVELEGVELDLSTLSSKPQTNPIFPEPFVRFAVRDVAGEELILRDYATAGMTNRIFTTWFKVINAEKSSAVYGVLPEEGNSK